MKNDGFIVLLGALVCVFLVVVAATEPRLLALSIAGLFAAVMYLYFLKKNVGLNQFILLLIPAIILSPMINIPGVIGIRLDDLWLAFGAVVYLTRLASTPLKLEFKLPKYTTLFIIFIGWIVVTIFISSFKEPYFYSGRDWLEVYKNLKLLLIIVLATQLQITKPFINKIFNVVTFSLLISAIFGIMQYFNVANVNSWLTPYFLAESQIKGLEVHGRIVGTYANPNVFGTAMLVGIGLSFSRFFQILKFKYLLLSFIFLFATFLTLSRTAFVACLVLVVLIIFQSFWKSKRKLLTLFSFSFVPLVAFIGLKFAPEKLFFRTQNLNNLAEDESFQGRLDAWRYIFELRTRSNIFTGTGPVSNFRLTFDNEWLMLLTIYGVVGLSLVSLWFVLIYFKLGRLDADYYNFYNIALRSILIVYGVSMFMEPIFQQLQLMPLIALLIGVLLNKPRSRNKFIRSEN